MRTSVYRGTGKADQLLRTRPPALDAYINALGLLNLDVCGHTHRLANRSVGKLLCPVIRGGVAILQLARNCKAGGAPEQRSDYQSIDELRWQGGYHAG